MLYECDCVHGNTNQIRTACKVHLYAAALQCKSQPNAVLNLIILRNPWILWVKVFAKQFVMTLFANLWKTLLLGLRKAGSRLSFLECLAILLYFANCHESHTLHRMQRMPSCTSAQPAELSQARLHQVHLSKWICSIEYAVHAPTFIAQLFYCSKKISMKFSCIGIALNSISKRTIPLNEGKRLNNISTDSNTVDGKRAQNQIKPEGAVPCRGIQ